MNKYSILTLMISFIITVQIVAQPRRELVSVVVSPDHADWTYKSGESAEFEITVWRNNEKLDAIDVNYIIQPELVDKWDEGTITFKKRSCNR